MSQLTSRQRKMELLRDRIQLSVRAAALWQVELDRLEAEEAEEAKNDLRHRVERSEGTIHDRAER